MSTKLDNHVGQLNDRFDTTDALVVEQAKHVIENMGGSNALLGTYQASLIDGLKTALDANMAREGTAVQEAVKAEVHTINCNFDLVLHALRDSLEKQQGNAHNVNCNFDLVIMAIREESEQQQTKLSEHVKTLTDKIEIDTDLILFNLQISVSDDLKMKMDANEAGVKTAVRSEIKKVIDLLDAQKRSIIFECLLWLLRTIFMMVWVAVCCAGAAFAVIVYMEAAKKGEIDRQAPVMQFIDRVGRCVFPNMHNESDKRGDLRIAYDAAKCCGNCLVATVTMP